MSVFSNSTKESANDVKSDVKSTYYNAKRDLKDAADGAGPSEDELANMANKAGRKVRGYLEEANEQISHAADKLNTEISANPVRSSLIALGVGYILGALLHRR